MASRFNKRKNCFCNNIGYSTADAIPHNLKFTQGVPCDLDAYADFNMKLTLT